MQICYIISSNIRYHEIALPLLLRSMNGIDPKNIFVAVGESPRNYNAVRDGVTYMFVEHNSFDYTGMIEVVQRNISSDWWFWLHDTCECGPRFRELAEGNFDSANDKTAAFRIKEPTIFGKPTPCVRALCNLGMYRHEWLMQDRIRFYLSSLQNLDKQAAIYNEGLLYAMSLGTKGAYPNNGLQIQGASDIYHTGSLRKKTYFTAVDLYKYQGIWSGPPGCNP